MIAWLRVLLELAVVGLDSRCMQHQSMQLQRPLHCWNLDADGPLVCIRTYIQECRKAHVGQVIDFLAGHQSPILHRFAILSQYSMLPIHPCLFIEYTTGPRTRDARVALPSRDAARCCTCVDAEQRTDCRAAVFPPGRRQRFRPGGRGSLSAGETRAGPDAHPWRGRTFAHSFGGRGGASSDHSRQAMHVRLHACMDSPCLMLPPQASARGPVGPSSIAHLGLTRSLLCMYIYSVIHMHIHTHMYIHRCVHARLGDAVSLKRMRQGVGADSFWNTNPPPSAPRISFSYRHTLHT